MEKHQTLFHELIHELLAIYDQDIKSIILYGSVARGTATSESDIDIAVIVTHETKAQHDQLLDLETDLNLKYDVVLSVIIIDADNFKTWRNTLPFYKNVRKDGIELWKAA